MALKFVIAWEAELPGEEHADLSISGLLSGLHKYGAEAFLIPAAYAEEKTLAQILKEHGLKPEEGLALVATDASLAQTAGLPVYGSAAQYLEALRNQKAREDAGREVCICCDATAARAKAVRP